MFETLWAVEGLSLHTFESVKEAGAKLIRFGSNAEKLFSAVAHPLLSTLSPLVTLVITISSNGSVFPRQFLAGKNLEGCNICVSLQARGRRKKTRGACRLTARQQWNFSNPTTKGPRIHCGRRTPAKGRPERVSKVIQSHSAHHVFGRSGAVMPSELEYRSSEQRRRFPVVPGVTGLGLINGRSLRWSEDYMGYDPGLIASYSAVLYGQILLLTPLSILPRKRSGLVRRGAQARPGVAPGLRAAIWNHAIASKLVDAKSLHVREFLGANLDCTRGVMGPSAGSWLRRIVQTSKSFGFRHQPGLCP